MYKSPPRRPSLPSPSLRFRSASPPVSRRRMIVLLMRLFPPPPASGLPAAKARRKIPSRRRTNAAPEGSTTDEHRSTQMENCLDIVLSVFICVHLWFVFFHSRRTDVCFDQPAIGSTFRAHTQRQTSAAGAEGDRQRDRRADRSD